MSNICEEIVSLLNRRKASSDEFWGSRNVHPLTGRPLKPTDRTDPFPPGATEQQLRTFSKRTGIQLPSGLAEWLRITNGATGFYGIEPVDQRRNVEQIWSVRPAWRNRAWLPVADDGFGNYYVQLCHYDRGAVQPVCFVEGIGDDNTEYVVASGTLRFALFYLEDSFGIHQQQAKLTFGITRIGHPWPFSKRYMSSRDPALCSITDLPLPWEA